MPPKPRINVQNFPRPPLLEKTPRHLIVKYRGQTIAETNNAYWVLETYHSPTYYLPASSLSPNFNLTPTTKSTFCEYKGWATYYSISLPSPFHPLPVACSFSDQPAATEPREHVISNRIWSYESPTPQYEALKGHLSFYAGPWDCFVDGEKVIPQPGDFYGGWTTSELDGIIKGSAETRWM
ncbi:badbd52c-4c8f-46c9-84a2-c2b5056fbd91 [Sclerotinia trifoliorum]|uniref:Badbd52c-4c8f-46c9-84a2-c2b5056fbd91 n=1 Tax=Sclerotinia trifoliorum TaxID=28548 RepID=A0A8H2ZN42_9HELO|nr:badbd52c-4c8f-46c9-84a2-c2b5056fbd91 [Sclerotinia trifoliorum]